MISPQLVGRHYSLQVKLWLSSYSTRLIVFYAYSLFRIEERRKVAAETSTIVAPDARLRT